MVNLIVKLYGEGQQNGLPDGYIVGRGTGLRLGRMARSSGTVRCPSGETSHTLQTSRGNHRSHQQTKKHSYLK